MSHPKKDFRGSQNYANSCNLIGLQYQIHCQLSTLPPQYLLLGHPSQLCFMLVVQQYRANFPCHTWLIFAAEVYLQLYTTLSWWGKANWFLWHPHCSLFLELFYWHLLPSTYHYLLLSAPFYKTTEIYLGLCTITVNRWLQAAATWLRWVATHTVRVAAATQWQAGGQIFFDARLPLMDGISSISPSPISFSFTIFHRCPCCFEGLLGV